jgi:hypothetical protein
LYSSQLVGEEVFSFDGSSFDELVVAGELVRQSDSLIKFFGKSLITPVDLGISRWGAVNQIH